MVGPDGVLPLPWLAAPLQQAASQPGHALLVVGAPGVGSLEFQLTLAQAWLCESTAASGASAGQGGGRAMPCGRCAACHLFQARTHPDLKLLMPGALMLARGWATEDEVTDHGKRKPSRWILIDQIRGALEWISRTSSRGRAKVLVLHPAEALQSVGANALLKTLEEPAAGARLLLSCSDPEHLLPTVRSRCQRLPLPAPSTPEATAWLQAQGVDSAAVLLAGCGGRPLDALALHQAGVDAAAWSALPRALGQGRASAWAGWPLPRTVDALQKLCHDLMAVQCGGAPKYFPPEALPPVRSAMEPLVAWAAELQRVARQVDHTWNEALLVDALVTRGRQALATLAR